MLVVHSEMSEDIDQPAGSKGAGRSQQHVGKGSWALGRGEALPKQAHRTANDNRNPRVHFWTHYDESRKTLDIDSLRAEVPGGQPRFQPPPSRRGADLGSHLLAKEFLGLADFSVPLLQLVRSQKTHDPLANLVALGS